MAEQKANQGRQGQQGQQGPARPDDQAAQQAAQPAAGGGGGRVPDDRPDRPDQGDDGPRSARPRGTVTIEIKAELNRQVLFGPTQERLRGAWDPRSLDVGETSVKGLLGIPAFPGHRVQLDLGNRIGRIFDPLALPENATLLAKVADVHKQIFGVAIKPTDPMVRIDMDDDELATWVYWMMRTVNGHSAILLEGELPDDEEKLRRAFPPKTRVKKEFYNSLGSAPPQEPAQAAG